MQPLNYSPTGLGRSFMSLMGILLLVALFVMALRIYTRLSMQAKLWWDDWLALAATFFSIGVNICFHMIILGGYGHHWSEVLKNHEITCKIILGRELLYHLCLGCAKLSALMFYMRAFATAHQRMLRAIVALVALEALLEAGCIVWTLLLCKPISMFWQAMTAPHDHVHCGNRSVLYMASSAFSIATDVLIIGLPLFVLRGLKMKHGRKTALVCLFSLGFIVTVVSVLRIVSITWIGADITYEGVYLMFFSALEPTLATICVSVPMLGPLYTRLRKLRSAAAAGSNTGLKKPPSDGDDGDNTPPTIGRLAARAHAGFDKLEDEEMEEGEDEDDMRLRQFNKHPRRWHATKGSFSGDLSDVKQQPIE